MKTLWKGASAGLLLLAFGAVESVTLAADVGSAASRPAATQPASSSIQFEVGAAAPPGLPFPLMRLAEGNYGVFISVRTPGIASGLRLDAIAEGVLRTPAGRSASEGQRAMMAGTTWLDGSFFGTPRGRHANGINCQIAAVSEDDAHKMAKALVEYFEERSRDDQPQARKRLETLKEKQAAVRETEKKHEEAQTQHKDITRQLDEMHKNIAYRNWDDATQDMLELDKALRSVDIELTSIQAKVDMTKKLQHDMLVGNKGSLLPVLDQMMFGQDIDRAGALARKESLEKHRKAAERYYQLARQQADTFNGSMELQKKLEALRNEVLDLESQLGPVEVVGKATIYRADHQSPRPATRPSSPRNPAGRTRRGS